MTFKSNEQEWAHEQNVSPYLSNRKYKNVPTFRKVDSFKKLQIVMFFFFHHTYFLMLTFSPLCHHMFSNSVSWTDAIKLISNGLEKGKWLKAKYRS